ENCKKRILHRWYTTFDSESDCQQDQLHTFDRRRSPPLRASPWDEVARAMPRTSNVNRSISVRHEHINFCFRMSPAGGGRRTRCDVTTQVTDPEPKVSYGSTSVQW